MTDYKKKLLGDAYRRFRGNFFNLASVAKWDLAMGLNSDCRLDEKLHALEKPVSSRLQLFIL